MSAASALAVAPRSSVTPAGSLIAERPLFRTTTVCAGAGMIRMLCPLTGGFTRCATSASATVGLTAPSVIEAARSAASTAANSSELTTTSSSGVVFSRVSSESSRKLEQAASNSATVRFTWASAAARPPRSPTATTARPPQIANSVRPRVPGAVAGAITSPQTRPSRCPKRRSGRSCSGSRSTPSAWANGPARSRRSDRQGRRSQPRPRRSSSGASP